MAQEFQNIKGFRELAENLQQLPVKTEKNIMRGAMRAGAKVYQSAARQLVPVKSSALQKSIKIGTRVRQGVITAQARTKVFYARFVEFGTAAHVIAGRNGGWLHFGTGFVRSVNNPGAKAKPFMRPAYDSQSEAAIVAVGNRVRDKLNERGIETPDALEEGDL